MTTMYVQCELSKNNVQKVSWIPEKFAIKGNLVDLKEDNEWDKGWTVDAVFNKVSEEVVISNRDAHKYHRKNTDI